MAAHFSAAMTAQRVSFQPELISGTLSLSSPLCNEVPLTEFAAAVVVAAELEVHFPREVHISPNQKAVGYCLLHQQVQQQVSLCSVGGGTLLCHNSLSISPFLPIKFIQALSQLWVPELVLLEPERDYLLTALLLLLSHFIVSLYLSDWLLLPNSMTDSSSSAFSAAYHSLSLCLFTTSPPLIIAHFSVLAAEQKIYRSVAAAYQHGRRLAARHDLPFFVVSAALAASAILTNDNKANRKKRKRDR